MTKIIANYTVEEFKSLNQVDKLIIKSSPKQGKIFVTTPTGTLLAWLSSKLSALPQKPQFVVLEDEDGTKAAVLCEAGDTTATVIGTL